MDNMQKVWDDISHQIDQIVDGLGKPIDLGIREAVIALSAHGFHTVQSCEGHLDHGIAGPWIDIESDEDTSILRKQGLTLSDQAEKLYLEGKNEEAIPLSQKSRQLIDQANIPLLQIKQKLLDLLQEFYVGKDIVLDQLLIVNRLAKGFRLENCGADLQKINSPEIRAQKLKAYQQEMSSFAIFLRQKFFAG